MGKEKKVGHTEKGHGHFVTACKNLMHTCDATTRNPGCSVQRVYMSP